MSFLDRMQSSKELKWLDQASIDSPKPMPRTGTERSEAMLRQTNRQPTSVAHTTKILTGCMSAWVPKTKWSKKRKLRKV